MHCRCTYMYMSEKYLEPLKRARETSGLTQKDVEDRLGLRSLTMRDYEIGRLKLPISVAIDLANLYKISIDELIGNSEFQKKKLQTKSLINFTSLFIENGQSVMFLDPILRAFLEDHQDKYFEYSLFELITIDFTNKQKKESIYEISRLLFALASCDGKVSDEEIDCLKNLLSQFGLSSSYKEISKIEGKNQLGKLMEKIELRHFTIWILYFFSLADKTISYQEIEFIDQYAEKLKINKSNYLFIKNKFVKESL